MKIHPIKAFSDNYIWVVEENDEAVVVDPGEGDDVMSYLEEENLVLKAILLTHNHDDHIGGVLDIYETYPDIAIYGPDEAEPLVDHNVKEGDSFELLGRTFEVFKTAGHTKEHISYLADDALFCGDALFSGGCGRVFTGDYQAQFDALQKFNALNDEVNVFAAHEYTETNLRFANEVDPSNTAIADALEQVQAMRKEGKPTLPSTIGREKEINLFMQAETLEDFTKLRKQRDEF
jgi:hydroxyacylglutathione hydrolase